MIQAATLLAGRQHYEKRLLMKALAICSRMALAVSIFTCFAATSARADFIITSQNTTITPGQTGIVNFYIASNGPSGDQLASIDNLELQISGSAALSFAVSKPSAPFGSASYVFAGNSFAADNSVPFWGSPSTVHTNNDTISSAADFNDQNSGPGYTLITSTPLLLASVEITALPTFSLGASVTVVFAGSGFSDSSDAPLP